MRTNTTKARLAEGKVVFGAIISRFAPDQVELFGALGYDFVMIDCEHGPMSLDEVEHMVRAAEVFGITARKGIAIGPGCSRPSGDPAQVACALGGPGRTTLFLLAGEGFTGEAIRRRTGAIETVPVPVPGAGLP